MATLSPKAYVALIDAFELTANQAVALASVFEESSTLTNMLDAFVASGGTLEYAPSIRGTAASGSLAAGDAVIVFGKEFQLGSVIDQKTAFADATLLAHELGHAELR